jgi:SAM-dependent methyltransferase
MGVFDRIRGGPVDLLKRAISKTLIEPRRYRSPSGYDAARYWRDRFVRYGPSLRGVGDEGLTEEENRRRYEEAAITLMTRLAELEVSLSTARVLDVGCGSGFYTRKLRDGGVQAYQGIDITDALFPALRAEFADYDFRVHDITSDDVTREFDLILMIDVFEHIVTATAARNAARNLMGALVPGGLLVLGPIMRRSRRHLFYVRFWSMEELRKMFSDLLPLEPVRFRDGFLMAFRHPPILDTAH